MTQGCFIRTASDLSLHSLFEGSKFRKLITGEKATLAEGWMKAGISLPSKTERQHSHEAEELMYILEGRMRLYLGDAQEEHVIEAGQVLYVPSWVPHGGDILEDIHCIAAMAPNRPDYATAPVVDDVSVAGQ